MQYFVTLYIHPMQGNIPHAFLGLTHTHPDELDKLKDIDICKYQVRYYSDKPTLIHVKDKWYNNIYPSILDSSFGDEGFFGFALVESTTNHWGKVYENNQYVPEWGGVLIEYYNKDGDKSTFTDKSNRCIFEISQEQYETLLDSILQNSIFISLDTLHILCP